LLLAGVAVVGWHGFEPRVDGRTLSEWLSTYTYKGDNSALSNAVGKIGPAAVPFLLTKLRARDPEWIAWLGLTATTEMALASVTNVGPLLHDPHPEVAWSSGVSAERRQIPQGRHCCLPVLATFQSPAPTAGLQRTPNFCRICDKSLLPTGPECPVNRQTRMSALRQKSGRRGTRPSGLRFMGRRPPPAAGPGDRGSS
jgi:hypothetical protein